ncbi:hypothetical protein NJ959_03985 [Symplocastrum sp. BBK-W-15]|uniref:Uncharacterized protein n=1 Tax=Limnofasciculus baicalensis BBK-W-15 TaxID=2699891 RepID=A0AAE3KLF1_9CYAN|nr:hypothetical protein [Limnofasciculus baicalensis BBK-W-15]
MVSDQFGVLMLAENISGFVYLLCYSASQLTEVQRNPVSLRNRVSGGLSYVLYATENRYKCDRKVPSPIFF